MKVLGADEPEEQEYERKYQALLLDIKKEFPYFKIVNKIDSRFGKLMGNITAFNKKFGICYTTTVGPTIFVNYYWDYRRASKRYGVMSHERIHMRQIQKFKLLPYFLIFALFPAPTKLAYFRKKWEQEAYELSIFLEYQKGGRTWVLGEYFQKYILDQFCGPFYMWMWHSQRDILKWLITTVRRIERGYLTWDKVRQYDRLPPTASPLRAPKLLRRLYPEDFT